MVLDTLTRQPLGQADTEALAELALLIWYERGDVVPALERQLISGEASIERQRRALYLIDTLRRFPCIPATQAALLKAFVCRWGPSIFPQGTHTDGGVG